MRWIGIGFLIAVLASAVDGRADDWPQLWGPSRNNTSAETGLSRMWPEGGPPLLWSVDVGPGFGGPAVVGGRVFLLDRIGESRDVARCLDAATGEAVWRSEYDAPGKYGFPGSRSTPAVIGDAVVTIGPMGHVKAFDRGSGAELWSRHLLEDFGGEKPRWMLAQSPLVCGDLVVLSPQGRDAGLVACNPADGSVVWKTPGCEDMSYSSPALVTLGGVPQIVAILETDILVGVNPADGSELWRYGGWECKRPIPAPVAYDEDRLFVSGGYGAGSIMLRVSRKDGVFRAEEQWRSTACNSQIHQPIVLGGLILANSNSNETNDGFVCLDGEGAVRWATGRDPNFERGGMLLADGVLLAVNGKTGDLALIEAGADGMNIRASANVLSGKQIWAPPVLADGRLYVRDQAVLKCFAVSEAGPR